jgi:hypothetical protein
MLHPLHGAAGSRHFDSRQNPARATREVEENLCVGRAISDDLELAKLRQGIIRHTGSPADVIVRNM